MINNFWFSALIVSIFYISDYFFTLKNSELYQKNTKYYIEVEGGVELNPFYQKDINKLKKINPKFIFALIGLNVLFYFVWYTSVKMSGPTGPFEFMLGSFILTEFFIHTRHFRSYFQSRSALKQGNIEGHIKYSRPYIHKSAALDSFIFSIMFLIFWLLTERQFFLGGSFACFFLAFVQRLWLKRYMKDNPVNG